MVEAPVPVTAVDDGFEVPASLVPVAPDEPVVPVLPVMPAVLPAVSLVPVAAVPVAAVVPVVVAGVVMVVSAAGVTGSVFLQPPSRAATATTLINNFDGVNAVFMVTPCVFSGGLTGRAQPHYCDRRRRFACKCRSSMSVRTMWMKTS
jgi:hypothetical protein